MPLIVQQCVGCAQPLSGDVRHEPVVCDYCGNTNIWDPTSNHVIIKAQVASGVFTGPVTVPGLDIEEMVDHAATACSFGDFRTARHYVDAVLQAHPTSGRAHLIMIMVEYSIPTEDKLGDNPVPLSRSDHYKYALKYLEPGARETLEAAEKTIRTRLGRQLWAAEQELRLIIAKNQPLRASLAQLQAERETLRDAIAEASSAQARQPSDGWGNRQWVALVILMAIGILIAMLGFGKSSFGEALLLPALIAWGIVFAVSKLLQRHDSSSAASRLSSLQQRSTTIDSQMNALIPQLANTEPLEMRVRELHALLD